VKADSESQHNRDDNEDGERDESDHVWWGGSGFAFTAMRCFRNQATGLPLRII
jgi:hypothetical protein